VAEPTGSTPVVEDDAEIGEYTADGELGAEIPSFTTQGRSGWRADSGVLSGAFGPLVSPPPG
jgi:hypothetical protein